MAIATGTAPALVQELDESADELMEDANALMGAVWPHVARIAGIEDVDRDMATAGLVTKLFADPALVEGVTRLRDFDSVMEELLSQLDEPE